MGVSVATLRNWEQDRREPQGPARSLLLVAKKQPEAVIKAFKASRPAPRVKAAQRRTGSPARSAKAVA
jgi:putative transcriptional regulator